VFLTGFDTLRLPGLKRWGEFTVLYLLLFKG